MESTDPQNLTKYLEILHKAADLSEADIIPCFRQKIAVDHKEGKGFYDPVTDADRNAEKVIRTHLTSQLPEHSILGEEFEGINKSSPYHWIIDPIDGTRAFLMGSPLWGSLIGLCHDNRPLLGLMNQPFTKERFWASPLGAFARWPGYEGKITTSSTETLSEAIITSTCPDLFAAKEDLKAFDQLRSRCKMTRFGGDCYNYCLLAHGGVDLVVESGLAAYDILPLVPLVEQAGGVISDWQGAPLRLNMTTPETTRVIAAATAGLHQQALEILSAV